MTASGERFLTLGLESSCDDTGVALLEGQRTVIGELLASQIKDHAAFGGVIPEHAARKHLETFLPLVDRLLGDAGIESPRDEIHLIAVTSGPGLIGSLTVGVMAARALSMAWEIPVIGVNHLEGHLFANIVSYPELTAPFLCLIVSGGHSEILHVKELGDYEYLGGTRDDAAGEVYDKIAKELGLPYPGGPDVDRLAVQGNPSAFQFPVPMRGTSEIAFSFSGLKTAVVTEIRKLKSEGMELPVADICASFQKAAVDALMEKLELASARTGIRTIALSGGVGANSALRAALSDRSGWTVYLPPRNRCTDNAVMIAAAGYAAYKRTGRSMDSIAPNPSWELKNSPSQ